MIVRDYRYIVLVLIVGMGLLLSGAVRADENHETFVAPTIPGGEYVPVTEKEGEDSEVVLIRENPEIEGLKKEIEEREGKIIQTEREIEGLNKELGQIYQKKKTLESDLQGLTLTNRKNEAQIKVTEEHIEQGQLKLRSLNSSIENSTENIVMLRTVLKKNYQQANEFESRGADISLLLVSSLFEALRKVEEVGRYSRALNKHLRILQGEVQSLEKNKTDVLSEKEKLQQEQKELEDRKKIYQFSIQSKSSLVQQTKNSEATYQKLLDQKKKDRLELLQEVAEFESQIEYLRDPKSVPVPKKGLLRIPFDIKPRITQQFGQTPFARANAWRYGKPFHDGMDFGTPSGTRLFASADGIVMGTGNTDLVRSCQSWGKWILIKHPFGLSTLYAHLSLIKVRVGDEVEAGDLIGYTGNTGNSTGPHLHLGVYDSNGIKVVPYEQISSSSRCRGLLIPVSAQGAKLDPSKYLAL